MKTVTGSNTEAYSYDANGNRTSGGNVAGVNNQLTTDGVYNYQYDGEGNRTKRTNIVTHAVDLYSWDYRNRLTTLQSKNAAGVVTQTVSYEYDIDDQRVKRTINGVVENYYLDGEQIAFVTDGGGNETFHYLDGTNIDEVLAQDTPTGMMWSLSDRLGTVDALTDASGVVVDKRTFNSFGRVLSETNPLVQFRYGYTGRERDLESGLEYYRARYYDSANGRFISVDPAGFGAEDTNLYRYVGNSSTMYTDPSGMWSWNDVQQGLNNFGRSWDTATNFWSRELVQPLANSWNRATQNAVNSYTDVVRDGQQRGGLIGTLEQGVGYFGGKVASVPGDIAETVGGFVKAHPVLTTRIAGVGRAIGGVFEISGGVATSEFGVGIPIVVKGVDDFQAGIRQLFTGQDTKSLIHGAVEGLTGSSKLAGFVDAGTSIWSAGSARSGLQSLGKGIAQEAAEETFAPGTIGAAKAWSKRARINAAELPRDGKIRYVPPKDWKPSSPLPRGPNKGYIDRFGNEWVKGPSRTAGENFEWDVQLTKNASQSIKKLSPDTKANKHLNVSLEGKITH